MWYKITTLVSKWRMHSTFPTVVPPEILQLLLQNCLRVSTSSSSLSLFSGLFSKHWKIRLWRGWSGPISSRSSLRRMYSGIISFSPFYRNMKNKKKEKKIFITTFSLISLRMTSLGRVSFICLHSSFFYKYTRPVLFRWLSPHESKLRKEGGDIRVFKGKLESTWEKPGGDSLRLRRRQPDAPCQHPTNNAVRQGITFISKLRRTGAFLFTSFVTPLTAKWTYFRAQFSQLILVSEVMPI